MNPDDIALDTLAQFDPDAAVAWFERDSLRMARSMTEHPDAYRQVVIDQHGNAAILAFDALLAGSCDMVAAGRLLPEDDAESLPLAQAVLDTAIDYWFDTYQPPVTRDTLRAILDQYVKLEPLEGYP